MFKYELKPYRDQISLTIAYDEVGLTGIFPTLKEANRYLEIGRRLTPQAPGEAARNFIDRINSEKTQIICANLEKVR